MLTSFFAALILSHGQRTHVCSFLLFIVMNEWDNLFLCFFIDLVLRPIKGAYVFLFSGKVLIFFIDWVVSSIIGPWGLFYDVNSYFLLSIEGYKRRFPQ